MSERTHFDGVLVVGAGLAGLAAALAAGPAPVMILTLGSLSEAAATGWAQGGVAAALGPGDSPALHALDTETAGAGLCDVAAVRRLTEAGPEAVRWLAGLGVPFDRDARGAFVLSREAAHVRARVARIKGDQAGAGIMAAMTRAAVAAGHVQVAEGVRATALLQDINGRVRGVLANHREKPVQITARAVILATGGVGGLYAVTTNPPSALGQAISMAAQAGADIADPEFVQFHPTAIEVGADPAPLATEALRGEGAVLVDAAGRRFMTGIHPLAEMAPRDVVARAVHAQIAAGEGAFLDARTAAGEDFPEAFPTVFAACMRAGLDPRIAVIPVAPAAHYHMGGVAVDLDGRTSLPGLYAAGECAGSGVHGANRLASNSLLEAAVFGRIAGETAAAEPGLAPGLLRGEALPRLPRDALQSLRGLMSRHAGVVRDAEGLETLIIGLDRLDAEHGRSATTVTARLIAQAALARQESRGAHCRDDYPLTAPEARRTMIAGRRASPIPAAKISDEAAA